MVPRERLCKKIILAFEPRKCGNQQLKLASSRPCQEDAPLSFSDITKECPDGSFDRLGDAQQRLDGNNLLPAFDFSEILGIQVSGLGQLFLGEPGFASARADGFANQLSVTQCRLPLFSG
jgi:hypothetical protein